MQRTPSSVCLHGPPSVSALVCSVVSSALTPFSQVQENTQLESRPCHTHDHIISHQSLQALHPAAVSSPSTLTGSLSV